MKAMILAAGRGTRLGRITETTPKCLVDIGGITILEHVVSQLRDVGVTTLVINLFYLGEAVRRFVEERRGFGLNVFFSEESELLNTGGGVLNARGHFSDEEPFFVHNADIYSELSLKPLLVEHERRDGIATLAVMERESRRLLLFDDQSRLQGWQNLDGGKEVVGDPTRELKRLAFSGIQVISPKVFRYFESCGTVFSLIEGYLAAVRAGEAVFGCSQIDDSWVDIGRPAHLENVRASRLSKARP